MATKYRCTFDEDFGWEAEIDNPSYDGPVTNIHDPADVYHVEADSCEEAIRIASQEKAIDDDGYCSVENEADYM